LVPDVMEKDIYYSYTPTSVLRQPTNFLIEV